MTTRPRSDSIDIKAALGILDSIKTPVILLDPEDHILALNEQAHQLFSQDGANLEGKSLTDLPNSDELVKVLNDDKSAREWTVGQSVYAVAREAAPHGSTLLLNDVSHYKRLNQGQNDSMRFILHDLRSPLTAIQGFASMMGSVGELNEKQEYFVTKVLSGVTQMTDLVENVQDAGRYDPESGIYELMRVPTDIVQLARKIVDTRLVPAEKTLSISFSAADNLPIINADETMLKRAITNLVDNAIKYTPTGGSIRVSVTQSDNTILVAVEDTGLGIRPEDQKQLFGRYVRIVRTEFKKIKGTGLGLFIVRSVAIRHGGDAWVKSEEGHGSTFYIGIPLDGDNLLSAAD